MSTETGRVEAVCVSEKKGTVKTVRDRILLRPAWGIEGDAHAGTWHRQVSLLAGESIDRVKRVLPDLAQGAFAENIITRGIDLAAVKPGDRLRVGAEVLLEVTQIGKDCHNAGCAIKKATGDCIMPREGIFAQVVRGGSVAAGDGIARQTGDRTVTVFIPAFNEETNLAAAVDSALKAVAGGAVDDYEILILNACSADRTGEIADGLAAGNPKIRVIHRTSFHGLGTNYMEGVGQARMRYFSLFPGDNENDWESFARTLALAGEADVIAPYTTNTEVRAPHRRLVSGAFVLLMNTLFRMDLRYFTGNCVYRTDMLRKLSVKSADFAYNAEILVKLVKAGCTVREIGITVKPTNKTAIFRLGNLLGIMKTVACLFVEIMVLRRTGFRAENQS